MAGIPRVVHRCWHSATKSYGRCRSHRHWRSSHPLIGLDFGGSEVIDRLVRVHGQSDEEVALDLAELGLLDGLPLHGVDGLGAGLLRAHHYHRIRRAVSLADCVVAQAARRAGASVATADPHLLDLCDEEGIATVPLPDSTGRRPGG